MKIASIELSTRPAPTPAVRIPLMAPVETGPAATDLILKLTTDFGLVGYGVTRFTGGGLEAGQVLLKEWTAQVVGEDALAHELLWGKARAFFANVGWSGIVPRAYAAFDIALWDLKAKAVGLPLHALLGAARPGVPFFLGDIATMNVDAGTAVSRWKQAAKDKPVGVLVHVGSDAIQKDADRVEAVRQGIGEDAWMGITAESRYDLGTAMAFARFFDEEIGIDWFESPIPTTDTAGYQRLSLHFEAPLAAGSSWDSLAEFRDGLKAGSIRILRPDLQRLGGITPTLKVVSLAEAFHVSCVLKGTPDVAVHLACGLAGIGMMEWSEPLQELKRENGLVTAPAKSGIGWEF